MQGSKKYTYILPDIYGAPMGDTSSVPADTLRYQMGAYWLDSNGSIVYGEETMQQLFEPDILHGEVLYGPVETLAHNNPPYYSKKQTITFVGDDSYWNESGPYSPDVNWEAKIYSLFSGNADNYLLQWFRDIAFRIDTPFNQQERAKLGEMSAVGYCDASFNYNFYDAKYEASLVRVREEVLPNLYAFITDDLSRNMAILQSMGGYISRQQANMRSAAADAAHVYVSEHMSVPVAGEMYFWYASNAYQQMSQKFINQFSVMFRNLIVPFENLPLLEQGDMKWSFPMFVEMNFSTDSATEVAQTLEDASLSTSLQRHIAAGCGGTNNSLLRRMGGWIEQYMVARQNLYYDYKLVYPDSLSVYGTSLKSLDLMTWWTNYLNGLIPQVYPDQTFVGPNTYSTYISSGSENNTLAQALSLLVFSGKLREIIKNNLRSYQEMVNGKECHSETLLYRIAKYRGTPENNQPIQNYWFPNSNTIDVINYIDTQVKYGSQYTYVVYAYQVAMGSKYQYDEPDITSEAPVIGYTCSDLEFPELSGVGCIDPVFDGSCVLSDWNKVEDMFPIMGTDTTKVNEVAADIVKIYIFSTSSHSSAPILALNDAGYTISLADQVEEAFGFDESVFLDALAAAITGYPAGEIVSIDYDGADSYVETPGSDYVAYVTTLSQPLVNVVEVPYFSHTGYMMDSPPVAPDVNIIPYRGDNSKVLIWLNSGTGDYEMSPIIIEPEEAVDIKKIRQTNFLFPNDPIRYKSDDPAQSFEVFRLAEKPEKYTDFSGMRRTIIDTSINDVNNPDQRSSSAELVDSVVPNQKYYYTFRSVDMHGNVSYPTPVYEIQLVDNDGAVYLLMEIVPMEVKEPPYDMTKEARRYVYVKPRITQGVFNPENSGLTDADSALATNNYSLGVADQSLWGKKYKVRFVSKSTGRKIDLNITYEREHVTTPKEEEIRLTNS